jgi:hypothetical protein
MGISSEKGELRDRVDAKRKRLEARLLEARAEGRKRARESVEGLQKKLDELGNLLSGGFESLSEDVSAKLNGWLAEEDEEDLD